ncbi:MAG: NADH-quinone oxidoreductase subunit NuoH [Anaerolineae bacterium]|nr:NADH-quinone oxidoreductase subunit NuoH [Anaerolineae bacterium]
MPIWNDPYQWLVGWLQQLLTSWGLPADIVLFLMFTVGSATLATGAMLWVTVLIWYERKVIGRIQDRFGPNRVGPWGIFQTIADMIKIFTKEHITPVGIDVVPFNLAPVIAVGAVLANWAVIPFSISMIGADLNVAVLYVLAVGGLGELGIVFGGWGSNNKFALLASFRAVAQLISYETPYVICLIIPVMLAGSMGLNQIVQAQQEIWFIFLSPVAALIFFVTSIAEVGRAPFDLVEAESELVSGFNIEYSGLKFGMFYVADFLHAFTISLLFAVLFLGGWNGPWADTFPLIGFVYLFLKTSLAYFMVILLRASMPRFRIDQMMDFNWKMLTPLALTMVAATALVNKLLPVDNLWLRTGGLILMNAVIWFSADGLLGLYWRRKLKTLVAPFENDDLPNRPVMPAGEKP